MSSVSGWSGNRTLDDIVRETRTGTPRDRGSRTVLQASRPRPDSFLLTDHTVDDRPASPGLVPKRTSRTAVFPTPTPGLPAGSVLTPFVAPSGAGSIFAPGSKRIATPRILDETYSSSGNPSNGPALEATNFTVLPPRAAVADVTSAQVLGDVLLWTGIGAAIYAGFYLLSEGLHAAQEFTGGK